MAAVMAVAACGVAPTAPAPPPPAPTPVPTPPPPAFRVVSTSPTAGATGIIPNTGITITFSQRVVPGSVAVGTLVAIAGTPGAPITISPAPVVMPTITVPVAGGGFVVALTGGIYSSIVTYTIAVHGTVQSLDSGDLLGSIHSFTFTTRPWTTPPTTLNLVQVGDGNITSTGVLAALGTGTIAGDGTGALETRGFVAFSLLSLPPNAIVLSAQYTAAQAVTPALPLGPYAAGLGPLLAEAVNWYADASITAADFIAPVVMVTPLIPSPTVTASTAATAFVQFSALALVTPQVGQPTVGIRFRFTTATDGDAVAEFATLTLQNLTVVYGVL
jgi:hypothetical protein